MMYRAITRHAFLGTETTDVSGPFSRLSEAVHFAAYTLKMGAFQVAIEDHPICASHRVIARATGRAEEWEELVTFTSAEQAESFDTDEAHHWPRNLPLDSLQQTLFSEPARS
jgi:hypothetical protein